MTKPTLDRSNGKDAYSEALWSAPWLTTRAALSPDEVAIELNGNAIRYTDLAARVDRIVEELSQCGVARGELVAVHLPNGLPIVELIHASFRGDFVVLLLNGRLRAPEIEFQLRDTGARYFVHVNNDPVTESIELEPGVERIRVAPSDDLAPTNLRPANSKPEEKPLEVRDQLDLAAPRFILYTSGTSGKPKGVVLSAANLLSSAAGSAALIGAGDKDKWLLCLPIFHIGGLSILLRGVLAGSCVILHEQFSPEHVNADIEQKGVTRISLVANMLKRILDVRTQTDPPPALNCVLLGGGPAAASLVDAALAAGFPVAPTYGLTEVASQVATRLPDDPPDAGLRPLNGTALKIVDDERQPVATGEAGEICVLSGSVTSGYWNRPDANRNAFSDGWLHTGDIGSLDAEGRLSVFDRRSDLIISGGENIYPAEVESVLLEHLAVSEAGVVGEADEAFGARPVAWLVAAGDETPDADDLREHCRSKLAGYKCPVKFVWCSALPRTASGKLLRRELGGGGHKTGE